MLRPSRGIADKAYTMSNGLELCDSRVSEITLVDGITHIYFSHVYLHKSKGKLGRDPATLWSQEVELVLQNASISGQLPPLPNTISEGFLEVGGIRHELIPLPFRRKVKAILRLIFIDGTKAEIFGEKPSIELRGKPIYLEDFL